MKVVFDDSVIRFEDCFFGHYDEGTAFPLLLMGETRLLSVVKRSDGDVSYDLINVTTRELIQGSYGCKELSEVLREYVTKKGYQLHAFKNVIDYYTEITLWLSNYYSEIIVEEEK